MTEEQNRVLGFLMNRFLPAQSLYEIGLALGRDRRHTLRVLRALEKKGLVEAIPPESRKHDDFWRLTDLTVTRHP